jgi:hypothetical protein
MSRQAVDNFFTTIDHIVGRVVLTVVLGFGAYHLLVREAPRHDPPGANPPCPCVTQPEKPQSPKRKKSRKIRLKTRCGFS